MGQILYICFCSSIYFHEIRIYEFFPFGKSEVEKTKKGGGGLSTSECYEVFSLECFSCGTLGKAGFQLESVKYYEQYKESRCIGKKACASSSCVFFLLKNKRDTLEATDLINLRYNTVHLLICILCISNI